MPFQSIALIGSFRQHYASILETWNIFTNAGIEITSPKGAPIRKEGIPFIRFCSDSQDLDDFSVQTLALHRILRADMTYVVAPEGYVGRTTSYEIGRIVQAFRPIYFSHAPSDLPLRVPSTYILRPKELIERSLSLTWTPAALFSETQHPWDSYERDLINRIYRHD